MNVAIAATYKKQPQLMANFLLEISLTSALTEEGEEKENKNRRKGALELLCVSLWLHLYQ
jgi:hypothetical protein